MSFTPFTYKMGRTDLNLVGELVRSFIFKGIEWRVMKTDDQTHWITKLENVPALHKPTKPEDWL